MANSITARFGKIGRGRRVKVLQGPDAGKHATVTHIGTARKEGPFSTAMVTIDVNGSSHEIHSSHLAPVLPSKLTKEQTTIVSKVLIEAESKKPKSADGGYERFYNALAQRLEKQGYDYDEARNNLTELPFKDYQTHVESNYEISNEVKSHPMYVRALKHHHGGHDPSKAMN